MKRFLLFILVCTSTFCFAQQDAQYTQYMYNTINVNPAYAGSRGAFSMLGLYRTQWVGLDGAPTTQTFSMHTPFRESRVGLGVSFSNDVIGPSTEQYFNIDFSYTIPTSEDAKLAFGIKGVANILNVDFTKLNIFNPGDVNFDNNIDNRFQPNFGLGVYYYTDKYYIGLSAPHILETKHFDEGSTNIAKERINYYGIAGYVFDLSSEVKLKPSAIVKYVDGAPLQVDLTGNVLLKERVNLGLAYRWSAALSAMAGFQINEKLMIGYAYDWETTELNQYNSGSHEIFLRFELFETKDKIISPRFF